MRTALCSLGVDARIGEVAGEYCPGKYSVNARGATKIMGVGQRLARHAAHVGGVIVVNMESASEIPKYAEPWFLNFDAKVDFQPCMTPEDLREAGLDDLGKKWK